MRAGGRERQAQHEQQGVVRTWMDKWLAKCASVSRSMNVDSEKELSKDSKYIYVYIQKGVFGD